jgi:hypothetical protein
MSDDRFERAMAAATPDLRDARFALAVLERAEQARWRRAAMQRGLRNAGLAAAAAALMPALGGWVATHAGAVQDGILGALALLTLVGLTLMMARRLVPAG